VLRIPAHECDVNAVCFGDDNSQIIISGSDDGLCKIWDKRCFAKNSNTPVGALAGHTDGITCIDPKVSKVFFIYFLF
jgi:WD repeat-containing protein 23